MNFGRNSFLYDWLRSTTQRLQPGSTPVLHPQVVAKQGDLEDVASGKFVLLVFAFGPKKKTKRGQAMTLHPMHVAILDDDPAIRRALNRLLTMAGMVVDTYSTASLLFDSIAPKSPNCLLLDFQMPEMNGLEVLKALSQRRINIPTIIITGHEASDSREACMAAGAVAYLRKPLDTEQLIEAIVNASGPPRPRA